MDRIELQVDLIGKVVVVLLLFPEGLEKILLQQTGGLVVGGEGGLGIKGRLVSTFVANPVKGDAFDLCGI